ncbi:MAG: hypothetical protein NUW37_12505 [Planctomycetes bacterium]|nr:hypothetical protein [Planctomycetota bacterium]
MWWIKETPYGATTNANYPANSYRIGYKLFVKKACLAKLIVSEVHIESACWI